MKTTCNGVEYEVRIKRSKETPKLVSFGKAGHSVYFARVKDTDHSSYSSKETGYDDPETFFAPSKWWAHTWMEQRDSSQYEGCAWVNIREAVETEAGLKMVFRGPMVDVDLEDGQVDRCPQPSDLMASAMTSSPNEFGNLLILQAASRALKQKAGPLDSVSIAEYLALWKAAGAKVGTIKNGQFVES